MSEGQNNWNEWSRHVLAELRRLNSLCEGLRDSHSSIEFKIQEKLYLIQSEVASLKTQATIWGALAGGVGSIIVSLVVGKLLGK